MTEPLLSINALTVSFDGRTGRKDVVKDVSFDIGRGEILGLVGESGAGKSMTGQAITGLIEPPGRITSGDIMFDGERISTLGDSDLQNIRGKQIGSIFQDPLTSLNPLFTVADQLTETLRRHASLDAPAARRQAIDLLHQVGIPNPDARVDDYPHMFSGGMRQRVVIALAIAGDPKLIIADEPTTALDVTTQAQIVRLIQRIATERGTAVLFVSHDLGVISQLADRVAVMKDGCLVEIGKTQDILRAPRQPYTKALISCIPPLSRKVERLSAIGETESDIEAEVPTLSGDHGPMVTVSDVHVTFQPSRSLWSRLFSSTSAPAVQAVKGVSFKLARGQTLGLVGESGSGKSTLAKSIAGLQAVSGGRIVFPQIDDVVLRKQMIFQDPFSSLNPRWRVRDIIAEPILESGVKDSKSGIHDRVNELLTLVGLTAPDANKFPHEFSGGQRQRISIARALGAEPSFLICDEPTSALDVSVQAQILNLMKDLQRRLGLTYLFITHDFAVVRFMADEIGVMRQGEIVELKPSEELFDSPEHSYTKELLSAVPSLEDHDTLNA